MGTRLQVVGLAVAIAVGLVGAGCGGGDDSSASPGGDSDAAATSITAADGNGDDGNGDDSGGDESDGDSNAVVPSDVDIPEIADGNWTGTAHFEMSGDEQASKDLTGGTGFAADGDAVINFSSEDHTDVLQIAFNHADDLESVVFVTSQNLSTGGTLGEGCSLTVTRNDDAVVSGSFACEGLFAVGVTEAREAQVDIEGTFEMTRPT